MKFQNYSGDYHLYKNVGEVTAADLGEECLLDCINIHCDTGVSSIADAIRKAEHINQSHF
ncbi:MAG: hypothetical protein KAS32_20210 [Candidatus Peribacteraceae bacterium]|nr:hypothetical protein [Candidatus Peribacteraceae bacterium]